MISRTLLFLACAFPLAASDFATYISDGYAYTVNSITSDSAGNTYATGSRFVVTSTTGATETDVFVTKVDSSGNITLLATLSGKGNDVGNGVAVDVAGNIYVVGYTTSPDFPLHDALQAVPSQANAFLGTGFVTKLSPTGSILYSTYLGGLAAGSMLNAVAADSAGNAYVTGETFASDYPHTAGLPNDPAYGSLGGISVAFFAEISPDGGKLVYAGGVEAGGHACGAGSSCFLSTLITRGVSIALDPSANAYIAGTTFGTGLPTTPGAINSTGLGAFALKVNAGGAGLGYVTLLGSANYLPGSVGPNSNPGNIATAIAADAAGNAYLAGWTSDPNFPATAGAFQSQPSFPLPSNPYNKPPSDAFVAKINPTGTAMVWATFLGGSQSDAATGIALDPSGGVWVAGTTASADFPATAGFPGGGEFVVELNSTGSALTYAARYPANTVRAGLSVDPSGALHLAGQTGIVSTVTPSASSPRLFGIANAPAGQLDGLIAPSEVISIYGLNLGVAAPVSATFNSSGYLPTMLAGIQVTIGGIAAPLLYVSNTQINAIVPKELVYGSTAELQVTSGATALPVFRTVVDQVIPGVFVQPGGMAAAALNQDGTVNSQSNPAPSGSIVSIWATGVDYASGPDGQMANSAQAGCGCDIYSQSLGKSVVPAYAGAAPGMPSGIVQINFPVTANPGGLPISAYSIEMNNTSSNTFTIYVSQ